MGAIRDGGWRSGQQSSANSCYIAVQSGSSAVALLWGKITQAGWDGGPQRVVRTDDCQVVDKESIGGGVIEPEKSGRILTENSVGAKFSLDRYHVSSDSYGNLEVSDSTTLIIHSAY